MFKNIAKIFSSHVLVKIIGLINIAIILHFLTINDFGYYSYYLLMLHLISVIIDPFLSAYLVEYKLNNYRSYNLGIFVFTILLLPVFYFAISVNITVELQIFILFSFSFIISGVLKSFLNVNERFLRYGLIDVFRQSSIFISTIVFFYLLEKSNYLLLLEFNYASSLVMMLILVPFILKKKDVHINARIKTLKTLFKNSKHLIFYTALIPVITFIDSYFVEKYLSERDLGLYSFSLKVYSISLMLVVPIFTVLNIKQLEIAKEKKYWVFFKKNIKKVFIFSVLLFLASVIFNYLITHFFYTEYRSSFIDTTILLCGAFITYLSLPFSFLIAYRKHNWLFFLSIIALFINIIVNYIYISKHGTIIAAMSTFLAQTIINLGAAVLSYYLIDDEREK
jgi:O-antigen/teichoic acid export membrane protein